jgi:hypothetical protein
VPEARSNPLGACRRFLELRFPLNLAKVFKYKVLVSGTESLAAEQ